MAKRFTDTNKYKKPFVRALPGAYKLLWDFLYHDCDHAGIWIVDFEIAQSYVGKDMPIHRSRALELFNRDEVRVVELEKGNKWFIPGFIEFQYGKLKAANRAHAAVIDILNRYGLIDNDFKVKANKPLTSPLQVAMDMEKDKELDKEKDKDKGEPEKFSDVHFEYVFDDGTLEKIAMVYTSINVPDQFEKFKLKVRGSPESYRTHDTEGLRKAFSYHLQHAKPERKQPTKISKNALDGL
jgi:hypothetical protein